MVERIEISRQQVQELLERLEHHQINNEDYDIIRSLVLTVASVNEELLKKNISIKRLRKLFAIQSEKSKNILPAAGKDKNREQPPAEKKPDSEAAREGGKKPKGHGRNGWDAYRNAETVFVPHETLKRGDNCPGCMKGKLYPLQEYGVFVHITADAPFTATKYQLEKLRCSTCNATFTAAPPAHTNNAKYDESAAAMLAILKYGSGFPFYRIDALQSNLDVPLPSSTQWEIIDDTTDVMMSLQKALLNSAAQGKVIHNDDTKMKVLSLIKENKKDPGCRRKGIFTSGFISRTGNFDIALYFTGRNTAGENLKELLQQRECEREAPIQMCDASSNNEQTEFDVLLANCLTHGRRKFVDLVEVFPQECVYIIEALRKVYHNDDIIHRRQMQDQDRLAYHQEHSGPVMTELHVWMTALFEEKKIEPNSSLGQAVSYMLRHWKALTLFLRQAGAPLDNNIVERALKKVILHRKNSLFFKTVHGALVGDCYMSIIHTCELNHVNPFHYLTQVLKHRSAVQAAPELWLPWNYQL